MHADGVRLASDFFFCYNYVYNLKLVHLKDITCYIIMVGATFNEVGKLRNLVK